MGLKVANIIEEGRYGGPQVRITTVAEWLKKDGIETVAVFPKKNSDLFYNKLTEKGIQTCQLTLHRVTRDKVQLFHYIIFFFPEVYATYCYLKKERFDIVHCNGSWQIKGVIAGKLAGAKVVWHLNDTNRPKAIRWCFSILARYFCDGFIFAGRRVEAYYLSEPSLFKKPRFQIQAPVNTEFFDPDTVEPDEDLEQNGCYNIITVGNINPAKGIEYFIEMACLLNKKFENLCFCIIGQHFPEQQKYLNKLYAMIEKAKAKNIFFKGWVEDVRSILKTADIYVCSSIHEASPISVWGAMAMAKSIVSTDIGDVERFIADGEDGFIVPPRSSDVLAEKVEILLGDEKLRQRFSEKVRRTAVEQLDVDRCVEKHAQAYRSILGS